jgi:hypothetical protein
MINGGDRQRVIAEKLVTRPIQEIGACHSRPTPQSLGADEMPLPGPLPGPAASPGFRGLEGWSCGLGDPANAAGRRAFPIIASSPLVRLPPGFSDPSLAFIQGARI